MNHRNTPLDELSRLGEIRDSKPGPCSKGEIMDTATQTATNIRRTFLGTAIGLTEQIERDADNLASANSACEDAAANIKTFEAILMQEIAAETNGDGKPKFSNETARNAELAVRKSQAENLTSLQESLRKTGLQRIKLQNQIEKNRTQVSLYKAFLHGSEVA